MVIVQLD
jgi:hypothetical protein